MHDGPAAAMISALAERKRTMSDKKLETESKPAADLSVEGEFLREAEADRIGLAAEFWEFLKYNKKWWLLPIVLVLLGVGILVYLSSTAAAPFIYPLF